MKRKTIELSLSEEHFEINSKRYSKYYWTNDDGKFDSIEVLGYLMRKVEDLDFSKITLKLKGNDWGMDDRRYRETLSAVKKMGRFVFGYNKALREFLED